MRRASLWVVAMVALTTIGCLHSPLLWSPDGKWLAYTVAVRPRSEVLPPGWLFETAPTASTETEKGEPRNAAGLKYRLWATRADTRESVLLEDGRGPVTSPGWHPNGTALAFGRVIPEGGGKARYE
ncbi:MAG TPA: biopolymer transporter Tol, partial [Isosphaeraceae bacterium]|nr:biopolymer transporter Tol [Isosphaeraceae bacterium]